MQIPQLHPDTIEQVKQRADIVDVVCDRVVLRKRGKDFVGLCPFHEEKTPSFTVSPTKQMYYCFGCGTGGNAIKFLMELTKRPFAEIILDLAQRYQVPVQTLEPEQRQELQRQLSLREQLYEILAIAAQFYQHALHQPQAQLALNYLLSSRQLNPDTIQQFQLGYAPPGWDTLYHYLVKQKHYPVGLLEQAGLIRRRQTGDGYYDYFRDRLMIPIHDVQGRVIAFGGRSLGDEQPKYLNSPDTEVFSKGKTLFALNQAKSTISQQDRAVVVEGYFDAIALHAVGITNVVASLGTALSLDQVRQLLRYTESKQLILNFDADSAGMQAAQRAIGEIAHLAYQGEVQLRVLNLPEGKDADEYLHSSNFSTLELASQQYQALLQAAPLWLDWQIQQIVANRNLKQADQFQQVAQQIVKLLKQINNRDTRNYYIRHCAEILSLGDARLVPLYAENFLAQTGVSSQHQPITTKQHPEKNQTFLEGDRSLLAQAEALLLRVYLHCPEQREVILKSLQEQDLEFSLSQHRFLWRQILEVASEETGVTSGIATNTTLYAVLPHLPADFISRLQLRCLEFETEMPQIAHLFHVNEKTQQDLLRAPQVIQAATATMERVLCEKQYRHFLELWEQTDEAAEPERSQFYYEALAKQKRRLEKLDRQRQFSLSDLI